MDEQAKPVAESSSCSSSTWWRVDAKTIVCSCWPSSLLKTSCNAPSFSWGRTLKKCTSSVSEILVSRSRRMSCGSCNFALVKSARSDGMVAENRAVCRDSGQALMIASSCEANPISKRRSASSKTRYSTRERESCASASTCCSRPGVPTITSGLRESISNCSSIESPPTIRAKRSGGFTKWESSPQNLCVCSASSRVGESTSARTPTIVQCALSLCSIGSTNAAVFPEPVRAIAATSWPAISTGIARRWIGVGTRYPLRITDLYTSALSPIDWKPPLFAFGLRSPPSSSSSASGSFEGNSMYCPPSA
mmetsp:Transcript_29530/g.73836  ORF Transcript_29530/g.73836 Transcript_29530/m.73836 type:complete len:307 (+) Transcript_29530:1490-2410(+)